MFKEIPDRIGAALLLLFLTKPVVDLFWSKFVMVGGVRIALAHVVGVVIILYFGFVLLRDTHGAPPLASLFKVFLGINAVSMCLGMFLNPYFTPVAIIDFSIRLLDSYLVFVAAYIAVIAHQYRDVSPFIFSVAVGAAIAVIVNVIAIKLGYGGTKADVGALLGELGESQAIVVDSTTDLRERGLYFDPGALANVALYSLVFTVFAFHLVERRRVLWFCAAAVVVACDLYLVYLSLSRSAMLLLAIFVIIYTLMVQRGKARVGTIAVIGLVLVLGVGASYERLLLRFEGDIAALKDVGSSDSGLVSNETSRLSDDISLGDFERLGNNRGAEWAEALNEIVNRSGIELLLGNFQSTVAHSDYVDVLSRNGFVGLIVYVLLLILLLLRAHSLARAHDSADDRLIHYLAFTLVTMYVLYSFPFRPLSYTTSAWYMWAMIGVSFALAQVSVRQPTRESQCEDQAASFTAVRILRYPQGLSLARVGTRRGGPLADAKIQKTGLLRS